ncbi:hypothetical protein NON08_13010 [Cetobacterium somerae]|uniref:hypothetical protein n=1 Tax=Cetobacterium sp. NK01 TaxID=2993530 RepID=UPI002115F35A|nr:hypothetical protein [Cetobacterium sp. NK01]MCQ8213420.1 hypothetical protein [Cetobacterium sp. NK01]
MIYFNSNALSTLNKKKSSRKKITFNKKDSNKYRTEKLLLLSFMISTIYCAFYG